MKLLRKLFAAKKRNQKEVKSLVGLHSSAMRSEKCEARSRTLVGVVSGIFLERQASSSYTVISLVISMSKLKTTFEKNSRLDVYFLCRLMYLLWPALAMAQSIPSRPIPSGHLSGFCHFCLEDLQMPHSGARRFIKKKNTQRLK